MNCRGETYVKKTTTITDCQFISDCHAEENGGAVWSASQNTQIIECTIQNCSAGSGGAVYFSEKDVKTNTGSVGGISNVETSTSPQNVSLPTGVLARGKITDGSITGCEAGAGSAVYVGHSAIFSGTSDTSPLNVTGNTVTSINDGAIHGGMLYFEGNVQVKDNTCSEDSSCMHNVLMQENNTKIIYTTANGLAPEASIGVYVPDTYFNDLIGVTKWGNPTEITFWASREQALYIATKPIHPSQQIIQDKTKDGSKTFSVKVEPNWEFFSVMLGFGPGVRILAPNSVVREMKRKIKKAAELYVDPLPESTDTKSEEE
jgi:hypothetical protein